jgi:hypothetical protein
MCAIFNEQKIELRNSLKGIRLNLPLGRRLFNRIVDYGGMVQMRSRFSNGYLGRILVY